MRATVGIEKIAIATTVFELAGTENGHDHDGEQQPGKGEQHVDQARNECVDKAAEVAGEHAQNHANRRAGQHAREADGKRAASAVQQAHENVAAEVVGTQHVLGTRAGVGVQQVLVERIDRQVQRGECARGNDDNQQDAGDHRHFPAAKAPKDLVHRIPLPYESNSMRGSATVYSTSTTVFTMTNVAASTNTHPWMSG